MARKTKKTTANLRVFGDLEKEVMEIIWRTNLVTVREVYEKIKQRRKIAYTTVMTIMDRLFEKGVLKRKKEGKTYHYLASYSKTDFFEKASQKIINGLIQDFGEIAIAQFVNTIDHVDPYKLRLLKEKIRSKK